MNSSIDLGNGPGAESLADDIGDIQVVGRGEGVFDPDHPKALVRGTLMAPVATFFVGDFDFDIEELAADEEEDVLQLSAQQIGRVALMDGDDERITALLQAGEEEAAVLVNAVEQGIPEVAQVEQQQAALDPRPDGPHVGIGPSFPGHLDFLFAYPQHREHDVQLGGGLGVVGAAGGIGRFEQVVQRQDGSIADQHILKGRQSSLQAGADLGDVAHGPLNGLLQKQDQDGGEAVVERGGRQEGAGGLFVGPSHGGDAPGLADPEAEHQGPEQGDGIHFSVPLNQPGLPGLRFQPGRREQLTQGLLDPIFIPRGHSLRSWIGGLDANLPTLKKHNYDLFLQGLR